MALRPMLSWKRFQSSCARNTKNDHPGHAPGVCAVAKQGETDRGGEPLFGLGAQDAFDLLWGDRFAIGCRGDAGDGCHQLVAVAFLEMRCKVAHESLQLGIVALPLWHPARLMRGDVDDGASCDFKRVVKAYRLRGIVQLRYLRATLAP